MTPLANMMIIRGLNGTEYVGESWSKLELDAYMGLPPKRVDEKGSHFDLVLLVPGREPVRCEVTFYSGCSALAIPNDVVGLIPREFLDPLEAMKYAIENELATPTMLHRIFWSEQNRRLSK